MTDPRDQIRKVMEQATASVTQMCTASADRCEKQMQAQKMVTKAATAGLADASRLLGECRAELASLRGPEDVVSRARRRARSPARSPRRPVRRRASSRRSPSRRRRRRVRRW